MACLLFTKAAGVKPALLAYRGTGPAMNDLIGGHVDFFCEQAVSVASQVKGGSSGPTLFAPANAAQRCLTCRRRSAPV